MLTLIAITCISFLFSYAATIPTIYIARRFGLVDDVVQRKHPAHTHQGVIPRAGGIALYIGIVAPLLFFIPINRIMMGILIGGFLIVLMGMVDDYFDISPYIRFFLNIAIVFVVILFGLGIPYVSNPFGGVIRLDTWVITLNFLGSHRFLMWSNIGSIIWIVALMNFVNWSKGVDGQMPGFVVIAAIFLGLLSFRLPGHTIAQESVVSLSFITAGSFAGFLAWNIYPQKIMPGYGGGALAGFLLGILSILSFGKLGVVFLLLSIPLIDALYVIARRLKNFKSPFIADAKHFHHRLLEIGWGKRRIALFYWVVTFLFGGAALFFHGLQKVFGLLMIFISLGVFMIIINKIKRTNYEG